MWDFASVRKRSSQKLRPLPSKPSPSAILTETLKKGSRSEKSLGVPYQLSPEDGDDARTRSLNKDLHILSDYFPDVQIEVLREVLKRCDGDSRLPISVEQLLKYKSEWARGRLQNPSRELREPIPREQQFRNFRYITETTKLLKAELPSIKGDALRAVQAEVNHSYTKARPILFGINNKSYWNIFTTTLGFKKPKGLADIPPTLVPKGGVDPSNPRLLKTQSSELNEELDNLFLKPLNRGAAGKEDQLSLELAQLLNQEEAEQAGALFECQVCFDDVTFEDISTCTSESHVICLKCVGRTLDEALFGQGWAQSINSGTATLNCVATSECAGFIPQPIVRRSTLARKAGFETWSRFETRLATEALTQSAMPLLTCPFCPYAEADITCNVEDARNLRWHFRISHLSFATQVFLFWALPTITLLLLILYILIPQRLKTTSYTSLSHLHRRQRTTKFTCLSPTCSRKSCLKCLKPWHDPHICHEPLMLSLRRTVEAARTAALKRTCPRCGTSFIKSSGCNKLTCTCGYAMCYLCRANLGKGDSEGGPGYRHFCQHFRPSGGKCTECERCDLFKAEEEDEVVKRAGEEAERGWREREGMVGVKGLEGSGNESFVSGEKNALQKWTSGEISFQDLVDAFVETVIRLEEIR